MKKLTISSLLLLFFASGVYAQPANNNCSGAITIIPTATCNPIAGTTAGATESQPGCAGAATDDVWYTFTANANALSIIVDGSTAFNAVVQLFTGTCGGTSLACANATGNGGVETITSTTLFVGTQYWIRVHHFTNSASSNPTFNICVTSPQVEPPCDVNSIQPSNFPCLNVGKICKVNGFCGTTQGYKATPTSTVLTPYTVNTWPQLSTAFCGSIENNSFMQFEADAATVQLRIYGSCTSGTGIQMMAFSYNNPAVCGSGAITTYGCFSPLTFPSPAAGIPLTFTGMVPGQTYYLMVDGFGGAICNYKIGADFGVQVSASVLPKTVSMCLGSSLNLSAGGGNGVYNWDSSPALNSLSGALVTATPTAIGNYSFVVNSPSNDPNCPSSTDTAKVTVAAQPTPNAGLNDSICLGETLVLSGILSNPVNTAQWSFVPPVGGPPPTVVFSPSANVINPTVTISEPGNYKFVFRETNTICGPFRDTIDVWVLKPQLTISSVEPSCFGFSDGEITISSLQAVNYSFDSTVTWVPTNTNATFISDTFSVCVRDILGCVTCDTVVVPVPPNVTTLLSNDTIVCENGTATVSAQAFFGTTFTYNWSHTSDLSASQLISPLVPGYYTVFAENQDGCESALDSIFVDVHPPLSATLTPGFDICPGDNAVITATAADGNGGPYFYTWSNGNTGTGTTNSITVSPAITTNYIVEVSDGCETTHLFLNMDLIVSPVPEPLFTVLEDSICERAIFELYNTTDPAMVQSSVWEISDGQIYTNLDTVVTSSLPNGIYDVSLTITSPDGCVNVLTRNGALRAMPRPTASFRYSPTTITALNTAVTMENQSTGNFINHWSSPFATPSTSSAVSPVLVLPEGVVDNYRIQLVAETGFGCTDTVWQIVKVTPEVILYAPNTFTPDNDEFNATWRIYIEGVETNDFKLTVYNRWGEVVWESLDASAEWDGTYKGETLASGSYNWSIYAKDTNTGEIHKWTGNLMLLK